MRLKDMERKALLPCMLAIIALAAVYVFVSTVAFALCLPTEARAASAELSVRYPVSYGQTEARSMLAGLNAFRTGNDAWWYSDETMTARTYASNLQPLAYDYALEDYAMTRAAEAALLFSHTRPSGTTTNTSECLCLGPDTAAEALELWKEDGLPYSEQGHRRGILHSGFRSVAIGHAIVDGMHCWTQEFSYSEPSQPTPTPANDGSATVHVSVGSSLSVDLGSGPVASPRSVCLRRPGDSSALPKVTLPDLEVVLGPDDMTIGGTGPNCEVDMTWVSQDPSVARVSGSNVVAVASSGQTKLVGTAPRGVRVEVPVTIRLFSDVSDPGISHASDIIWLGNEGVTSGFPDGTFRPYASVARCDMAAFLFRIACRWGLASDSWQPSSSQCQSFSDVTSSTSHAREIWWLASQGVSTGWGRGSRREFRPYVQVARQDMAAFLFRLAKLAGKGGTSDSWTATAATRARFRDVSATATDNHHQEVWWLAQTGVSEGWPASGGKYEFRGTQQVARCDMAAFLRRVDALT